MLQNRGMDELFDEWVKHIEEDILELLRKAKTTSILQIAEILKLSERATLSVIYRMAQQGTVRITGIQPTE
jgi:DNA-binding Lrp family transcriptional regulator